MSIALRPGRRLAAAALLGCLGLALGSSAVQAQVSWEKTLPGNTLVYLKVEDAARFRDALKGSPLGQLAQDPALKPLVDDVKLRLTKANEDARATLGLSIEEILELPQGPVGLAVLPVEGGSSPVSIVAAADAGTKADDMAALLAKLTKMADDQDNVEVTTDEINGLTFTSIKQGESPLPLVWTRAESTFLFGTGAEALKGLIEAANGREDSLAANEHYLKIQAKSGTDAHLSWFVNIDEAFKQIGKALESRGAANAAQINDQLELTGLTGLKAAGGSVTLDTGPYATLSKAYLLAPGEPQGLVRLFVSPQVDLKPEPWVPAAVASYQSVSWDLDAAYKAINDLAETVAPGVLATLEQNLAGAGGDGLKFERDIFGPLGDRISVISDFKTGTDVPTQRILFAIALDDAKAFQATLNKILALTGAQPKKREFQGSTIYDFPIPELPNADQAGLKGPISLTIAKDYLLATTEPTLLEQVLRGGSSSLADSPDYQAVAKQFPAAASTLSFQRPEQSARVFYDLLKSGQFKQILEQSARASGNDEPVPDVIDTSKLPDFSVFAKYLTVGGGYTVTESDGVSFTQFTLKK